MSYLAIGTTIREKIENATSEQRVEMLEILYNKWIYNLDSIINKSGKSSPDLVDYLILALNNFNLNPTNLQIGTFEKERLICITELSYLRLFFDQDENIKDKPEKIRKFNKIFRSIVDAENTIRNALHLQNSMIENDIGEGDQLDITRYSPMDTSNNTPYQNLLLFLLENLLRKGYRRYNGECYEKIYTDKGFDTHTWKLAMSLKEFIYKTVRKELHYEMWQNLTHSKDNVRASVTFLSEYEGGEFEDITKNRNIFSFKNGIYISKSSVKDNNLYTDEWIPYEGPDYKKIGTSVIACNYFNNDFDETTRPIKDKKKHRYNDWFNIVKDKCPSFKSIMEYQEWPEDVQRWLCILIGRTIYEVGELDGWQIIGYLLGQAGSGKSTIINYILKRIYEKCDIGVLSNNTESKFGLSSICDKLMFIAPEVKANFSLEQSEFQSLVSGESMSVAVKNLNAKSIEWKVPGMMAGNEVPQYSDNAGSISRRLLVFLFDKKVKNGDTQLGSKLEFEMPHIIHACNRGYLEMINKCGSEDIWSIVPKYFLESRDEMAETTNALTSFLRSDQVIVKKDVEVPESTFIEAFNHHCKELSIPRQRWNHQYCLGPFSSFGISIKKHAKNKDTKIMGTFFNGVTLSTNILIALSQSRENENDPLTIEINEELNKKKESGETVQLEYEAE